MNALRILPEQMKKDFFDEIRFFVWVTYDYDNYIEFLHKNGQIYFVTYFDGLEKIFPVIKNYRKNKNWIWHFMEMGGGIVFIHKEIAEIYKKYSKIDREFYVGGPNFDAAIKAVNKIYNNWIYCGNGIERYFLGQPEENNLLIFGINPSNATPNNLDNTMKNILKILWKSKDFSNFGWIMMNLYPQVTPHPKDLKFDKAIIEKNLEQIEYIFENFKIENVWCAWGNAIDSSAKKFYLYDSLKKIYKILSKHELKFWCYGKTTTNNPSHPLYKPLDWDFDEFDIKNYIALKNFKSAENE